MRLRLSAITLAALLGMVCGIRPAPAAFTYPQRWPDFVLVPFEWADEIFSWAQVEPVQPVQPVQPIQPIQPLIDSGGDNYFGGTVDLGLLPAERQAAAGGGAGTNVVTGDEATVRGTTDTGDLLGSSISNTGVHTRQISPIINDIRIRGYRYGQIRTTADGAFWFPVRPDLDTPLSRFDSSIVQDVIVIKGPYSVRHGPGFAFIDIALADTPRYCYGLCWEVETKFSYDTNGQQWYGRQIFQTGSNDWGMRIGYGHKGGVDYTAGDGLPLATSYNSRDWDFAFGIDLSPCSSVEFLYLRTEMTDVDLPSQVNDLSVLVSDGLSIRYRDEGSGFYDLLSADGWYNQTRFRGNSANKATADFSILSTSEETFGQAHSVGGRVAATWGDPEDRSITLGADYTERLQEYFEDGTIFSLSFGLANGRERDAGIFADGTYPLSDLLTMRAGGRVDFVQSEATAEFDVNTAFGSGPSQYFLLGAGYVTFEYEANEVWTLDLGFGVAQRAPTLTELFADLPFLSVLQTSFSATGFFLIADNDLVKSTAKQIDAGARWDCCCFRGGIRGFYSWVDDFITIGFFDVANGVVNHDSVLAGAEGWFEYEVNDCLTAFGTVSYTDAINQIFNEPLWGIAPLEGRVGLRLTEPCEDPRWGVEYIARLVDSQDRLSISAGFGELPTGGFAVHELRGYFRFNETFNFVSGVENIFDKFYVEHLDARLNFNTAAGDTFTQNRGVPRRGRSIYAALVATY